MMKMFMQCDCRTRVWFALLAAGTLAMQSACQSPGPGRLANSWAASEATWETRALENLNDRLTRAYEREDVAMLKDLLADAHVHNNVFGSRMDRDTFLADIASGTLEFVSYTTPSIEWFVGDDLAIATGVIHAVAKRDGNVVPANAFRFTRVFARKGDTWKVLLFHNTMMGKRGEG